MRKKLLDVIDELMKLVKPNPKGPLELGYNNGVMAAINKLKSMYGIKEKKND